MVASNALPPVPGLLGEGGATSGQRRLNGPSRGCFTWLEHQTHDDYWRDGWCAGESFERIEAATMIVGGWADGYTNICLRSFPELTCPVRVLFGPWPHGSPETCLPGPNIDLVAEMLRWFDRWLKGIDNGIDREPPIVVYQQRSTAPDPLATGSAACGATSRPGRRSGFGRDVALRATPIAAASPARAATDALAVAGDVGATAWISCAGRCRGASRRTSVRTRSAR